MHAVNQRGIVHISFWYAGAHVAGEDTRTSRERMVWYSAFTLASMSFLASADALSTALLTSTDWTQFAILLHYCRTEHALLAIIQHATIRTYVDEQYAVLAFKSVFNRWSPTV